MMNIPTVKEVAAELCVGEQSTFEVGDHKFLVKVEYDQTCGDPDWETHASVWAWNHGWRKLLGEYEDVLAADAMRKVSDKRMLELIPQLDLSEEEIEWAWEDLVSVEDKAEAIRNLVVENIENSTTDSLNICSEVLEACGVSHVFVERSGYSQGESVAVIALYGEDYDLKTEEAAEAEADALCSWYLGDVYGVTVTLLDEDGEPDPVEWESCWGFVGGDFEKSGLAEFVRGTIEHMLENELQEAA